MLTLSIVVYHSNLGGIGLGLCDSDRRRIGHRGHGCGWHHKGRHNKRTRALTFLVGNLSLKELNGNTL